MKSSRVIWPVVRTSRYEYALQPVSRRGARAGVSPGPCAAALASVFAREAPTSALAPAAFRNSRRSKVVSTMIPPSLFQVKGQGPRSPPDEAAPPDSAARPHLAPVCALHNLRENEWSA